MHQRELGRHVDSFASGLRAALRENPDIILLGEMRDPETIRLALTAAETGHLVLSTLHSGSAVMAIERIVHVFSENEKLLVRAQLANVLRQVVAQQLVPAAGGGLLPALEILTVTHAVAAQTREGRTAHARHPDGDRLRAGHHPDAPRPGRPRVQRPDHARRSRRRGAKPERARASARRPLDGPAMICHDGTGT